MSNGLRPGSIALPIRNGENYPVETLDMMLAGRYEKFGLILLHNGSTDQTASICQSYGACDKRIR